MESRRKMPWLAFALAGVGHAAFFGGLLLIRSRPAPDAESEPDLLFLIDAPEGDSGAGRISGGSSPAGFSATPTPVSRVISASATPVASVIPPPQAPPPRPPVSPISTPPPSSPPVVVESPIARAPLAFGAPVMNRGEAVVGNRAGAGSVAVAGTGGGKGAAGESGSGSAGRGGEAPRYRRRVEPDYPGRARRLGLEGDVVLRIHIAPSGEATSVDVAKSSGHRILDDAAREAALDSEYEPAKRDGRAVSAVAEAPVTFRLSE